MKMTFEEAAKVELYGDKNIAPTGVDVEVLEVATGLLRDIVCLEGKLIVQRSKNERLSEEVTWEEL